MKCQLVIREACRIFSASKQRNTMHVSSVCVRDDTKGMSCVIFILWFGSAGKVLRISEADTLIGDEKIAYNFNETIQCIRDVGPSECVTENV
eukprot:m.152022 g.152022  ORF g.152022 m.152022 type:complete len:92 (-) comp17880_c0_seq1:705-980(-)